MRQFLKSFRADPSESPGIVPGPFDGNHYSEFYLSFFGAAIDVLGDSLGRTFFGVMVLFYRLSH